MRDYSDYEVYKQNFNYDNIKDYEKEFYDRLYIIKYELTDIEPEERFKLQMQASIDLYLNQKMDGK